MAKHNLRRIAAAWAVAGWAASVSSLAQTDLPVYGDAWAAGWENWSWDANSWQEVVIPLTALGVADSPDFDGFWIQDRSGTTQAEFFLDDVVLRGVPAVTPGTNAPLSGALAQADLLGIFGREGLDLATRWTTPDTATPAFQAMRMYRNYDGAKSTFGDIGVRAGGPNPDELAAFAAERTTDGALTVMLVHKRLARVSPLTLTLSQFAAGGRGPGLALATRPRDHPPAGRPAGQRSVHRPVAGPEPDPAGHPSRHTPAPGSRCDSARWHPHAYPAGFRRGALPHRTHGELRLLVARPDQCRRRHAPDFQRGDRPGSRRLLPRGQPALTAGPPDSIRPCNSEPVTLTCWCQAPGQIVNYLDATPLAFRPLRGLAALSHLATLRDLRVHAVG